MVFMRYIILLWWRKTSDSNRSPGGDHDKRARDTSLTSIQVILDQIYTFIHLSKWPPFHTHHITRCWIMEQNILPSGTIFVYREGDIVKQPMKKGSFVPKNVPGVGWGGVGGSWRGGVGWGRSWRGGVGWGWVMKGWGGSCRGGVGWVMKGWGGSCRGGVGWVKTQKIITHRVSKIHKWI